MKPADTRRVIVDTTVQPKNVMFPTDAKLIHRTRERLVRLAMKVGLDLRQSYVRVGKLALIAQQRYAHAIQVKRANRALRTLKTYLGRTIRDIRRQIAGDEELDAIFKWSLYQGETVLEQRERQRGRKIYSRHAHEVECIGKGKAQAPYEFGVKVLVATTLKRSKGGQFAPHAKALPGSPYDGHTLATIIPDMENAIGNEIDRIFADADTAATTRPRATQVQSVHRRPEAARDTGDQTRDAQTLGKSSPSSAISKPSIAWAATISPTSRVTYSYLPSSLW
jgi:IS5 family transposase